MIASAPPDPLAGLDPTSQGKGGKGTGKEGKATRERQEKVSFSAFTLLVWSSGL